MASSRSFPSIPSLVAVSREGARRATRAARLVLALWLLTLLTALPLALVLRGALVDHFGSSAIADEAVRGLNHTWWDEFEAGADAVGKTLTPSVIGFAAVLDNVSHVLDGEGPSSVIAGAIVVWMLVWTFLTGGIIERLARDRRMRSTEFFAACGGYVFRLVRLGIIAGVAYWLVFRVIHPALFDTLYGALTRDLAVERTAFFIRVALYIIFALLVLLLEMTFDVARVRLVIEERRSAIGAWLASLRFLRRHGLAILALDLLGAAALFVLFLLYALLGTRGAATGLWLVGAVLVSQAYVIARIWIKLQVMAAVVTYYQQALLGLDPEAAVVWPESPSAEDAPGLRARHQPTSEGARERTREQHPCAAGRERPRRNGQGRMGSWESGSSSR